MCCNYTVCVVADREAKIKLLSMVNRIALAMNRAYRRPLRRDAENEDETQSEETHRYRPGN